MRRFLAIMNTNVVAIKDFDRDLTQEVIDELFEDVDYDTIVEDFTNTYNVGDTYELGDWEDRNNLKPAYDADTVINTLWKQADTFEKTYISGSVHVLLAALLSVDNTKAIAIKQWVRSIWNKYYAEKQLILDGDEYKPNVDFKEVCGDCPVTVPELIAEYDVLKGA